MLHLCLDARLVHSAGLGRFLKGLLTTFTKERPFTLSLLGFEKDLPLLQSFHSDQLIVCKHPIYSIGEQLELPRKIPRCDLFWSPHFNIPLLPIAAKRRLTTIHDVYHLAHFNELSLPQKLYAKAVYHAAFSRSDLVTTVSHFSKEEILKYARLPPKRLEVIYQGIAVERFGEPLSKERSEQIQTRYHLPPHYLLFVGNIKPHKNLARLLAAYQEISPKEHLVIVGPWRGFKTPDPTFFSLLNENPFLRSRVHLLDFVPDHDLPPLYARASLFVFPSLYEGFGYPPLEAMAAGCPVVATTAGSVPEVCQEAAHYIDPTSVSSLAKGIATILRDPKKQELLRRKGREQVQRFHVERTVRRYIELIEETFGAHCSRP